jgi:hypothetical protein
MKIYPRIALTLATAVLALAACTTVNQGQPAQPAPQPAPPAAAQAPAPQQTVILQPQAPAKPVVMRPQPIKITATGNGSMGHYGNQNSGQQRLMAMRAAKLDAFRNLAEQVYGFQISGSTTLNAFAAQNDNVRSYVEAFMRGAKVVDMTAGQDGIYEATVELELPPDFRDCIVRGTCFPQPDRAATGCVGPNCAPMAVVCSGAGCASPSGAANSSWWSSLSGGN